jgi:hypothetical protein
MARSQYAPQMKNPIEDVEYFDANPMWAQGLKKSCDPVKNALYRSLRADSKLLKGEPAPEEAAPEQPLPPPTAEQTAAAVKKYPRERVIDLFKRNSGVPGEVAANLSKEDYKEAQMAARFFGIIPSQGGASVTFSYETSRARREAREAREAAAKAADKQQAESLPPGISREANGNLILTDEAAFTNWKKEKSEHADALKFLEDAAK